MVKWKSALWVVVCVGLSAQKVSASSPSGSAFSNLRALATKSLEKNIRDVGGGRLMLSAGDARLRGYWTRDFSFAAGGLYAIGRSDVARDQLTRTLEAIRPSDGCLPRTFGNEQDFFSRFAAVYLGALRPVPREPLNVTYMGGGNGEETVDSNALLILAALDYVEKTGDWSWWKAHVSQLVLAFRYYERLMPQGLILQFNYADWQDGVKRHGQVFFSNLAYWSAMNRLQKYPEFGISPQEVADQKQRLVKEFFSSRHGLFHSMPGYPYVSLEDNLLAINWGLFESHTPEAKALYRSLKKYPLWTRAGFPGGPTYPEYPNDWVGAHNKNMGLRHYHDTLMWSWLIGLSAKTAYLMDDQKESDRIFGEMQKLAVRDQTISEIYWPKSPHTRWSTMFNSAEIDFAWGSGVILDALETAGY